MVVVFITSENVTVMSDFNPILLELSAGLVETTVGLIPSTTKFLFPPRELELLSSGSFRSASLPARSLILPELRERALVEV